MLTISNFSHVIQEYSSIFSSEITLVYCSGTEAKSPLFHLVPGGLQSLQQPGQQLFCQRGVWSNLNQNPTSLKTKGIKLPYTSSLYQVWRKSALEFSRNQSGWMHGDWTNIVHFNTTFWLESVRDEKIVLPLVSVPSLFQHEPGNHAPYLSTAYKQHYSNCSWYILFSQESQLPAVMWLYIKVFILASGIVVFIQAHAWSTIEVFFQNLLVLKIRLVGLWRTGGITEWYMFLCMYEPQVSDLLCCAAGKNIWTPYSI